VKRIFLAALILPVALVLYEHRTEAEIPPPASTESHSVSVVPARLAPMIDRVTCFGNLVSKRSVNLVAGGPGQVKAILFTSGESVIAGTPLAQMDSVVVDARLQAARARAATDKQDLRRVQILADQGLASQNALDAAKSRMADSEADLRIQENRLDQLTVRAPFAGTLGNRLADTGAYLTGTETIVRLEDTSELLVEFRVPASTALAVTEKTPVHIEIPSTNQVIEGHLSFIDPITSPDTRSVMLRAVVPNPSGQLRLGLYVKVALDLRTVTDALVVPTSAIITNLNGSFVFVVDDDGVARKRKVVLGLRDPSNAEILSGVKLGENVVTIGEFRLRDGDPVKIVPLPPEMRDGV